MFLWILDLKCFVIKIMNDIWNNASACICHAQTCVENDGEHSLSVSCKQKDTYDSLYIIKCNCKLYIYINIFIIILLKILNNKFIPISLNNIHIYCYLSNNKFIPIFLIYNRFFITAKKFICNNIVLQLYYITFYPMY